MYKKIPEYKTVIDCVVKIYKQEGIISFYRGLTAALLKSVPASATTFYVYSMMKNALTRQ